MTEYTFAEIPNMIKVLSDAVVSRATDKMINRAARTATGVSQGGTLVEGYVPFADGDLAGSLVSSLYGSTAMSQEGDTSYELVVGSMEAGDVAEFKWTAEHAMRRHYGFVGTDSLGRTYNEQGWLWVSKAVPHWPSDVAEAVAEAKAELG